MILHKDLTKSELNAIIRNNKRHIGGNIQLKIFGRLDCKSGIRMKKDNRVFFNNKIEALDNGFRPCGNCMKEAYLKWKNEIV
jgi:methylphosphotriester-DNA--protein-cysteine methyltransferase